jgi:O-antigen/teichoic acid export membrane protein
MLPLMPAPQSQSLIRRAVVSLGWRFVSQLAAGAILFGRSVLLARLLPVETFGVMSLALAIVGFTEILGTFGLGSAFLNRSAETEDEGRAAVVHFTLLLAVSTMWWAGLSAGSLLLASGPLRVALVVLAARAFVNHLGATPRLILVRRVQHRRLATIDFTGALVTTAVGVTLALRGADLWALLAIEVTGAVWGLIGLYGWRPVWRPRLVSPRRELSYFFAFGLRVSAGDLLSRTISRLDTLWTGVFLGEKALGFYSRARVFAGYPDRLLSTPASPVTWGTYAELKGDRRRLSQAFFDTNAALLRAAFLLGGLLLVAAPELTALLLGRRWLPMVPAFRFMLLYALLHPIMGTVATFFLAVGAPQVVVQTRVVQLVVVGTGVFAIGGTFGIAGVAFAVGLMQLAGLVVMLWRARHWIDISVPRLVAVPSAALALAFAAVAAFGVAGPHPRSLVAVATLKVGAFGSVYVAVLAALEHRYIRSVLRRLKGGLVTGNGKPNT